MESESPTLREGDAFERPESEVALLHGLTMGCQWTISSPYISSPYISSPCIASSWIPKRATA
jgi:hypothetical protein